MMKRSHYKTNPEYGVSSLIEYVIISGILMLLLVIMLLMVNNVFIENPSNQLKYYEYTDIANGISARLVDVYEISNSPFNSQAHTMTINSNYNIPSDVAGQNYNVEISGTGFSGQDVVVSGGSVSIPVAMGGIGSSLFGQASGNTTNLGMHRIIFSST
jgi:hypothetical protein